MKKYFCLIISALLIAATACKKENTEPEVSAEQSAISSEKTDGKPGSVISATTSFSVSNQILSATLNGISLDVWEVDNKTIAFIIPEGAATGNQIIKIKTGEEQHDLSLNVLQGNLITDPEAVINDFTTAADNALAETKFFKSVDTGGIKLNTQDIAVIEKMLDEWKKQVNLLTLEEKKKLALMIDGNEFLTSINSYDFLGVKSSSLSRLALSETSDEIFREGKRFVKNSIQLAILLDVAVATGAFPDLFSKVVTLGSSIAAGYTLVETINSVDKILKLSFKPENFDLSESASNMKLSAVNTFDFINGKKTLIPVRINFKTLQSTDINSPSAWIKNIAVTINGAKECYNGLASMLNKFTGWFSWSSEPALAPWTGNLPASPNTRLGDVNGSYLKIKNISNPNIYLALDVSGNEPIVMCESLLPQETDFTFELAYENSQLNTSIVQKVNGKYKLQGKIYHEVVEKTFTEESSIDFKRDLLIDGDISGNIHLYVSRVAVTNAWFNMVQFICNGSPVASVMTGSSGNGIAALASGVSVNSSSNIKSCNNSHYIAMLDYDSGKLTKYGPLGTTFYTGFRFYSNGKPHYGWIKMSVASDALSYTVHEFAYSTEAETGIKTGQVVEE